MLKQISKGVNLQTVSVSGSTADMATLAGILHGKVQVFKSVGTGGTDTPIPVKNYIGMSYGHKGIGNRKSCSVFFPHIKPSKTALDLSNATKGVFNADFINTQKSTYANAYALKSEE